MPQDNITPNGQSGDTHVIPSDPNGAVGSGAPASTSSDGLTLAELNQQLGKNFTTKEAALKSLSDTFSYVGKKKEDILTEFKSTQSQSSTETTEKLAKQIESLSREMFYKDNPDYAKPEVRSLIDKLGSNPAEIVQSTEFKAVFDKVKGYDESQRLRTVLDSNPRLASSKDALAKAADLRKSGGKTDDVEGAIADAILSAYDVQ